jgi:hypothetical protein
MTIRTDLDQLIDWYEQHCHIEGRVIPVIGARSTIGKFARKVRGGPYIYRNCEIVPIRRAKNRRQTTPNKQTELQT